MVSNPKSLTSSIKHFITTNTHKQIYSMYCVVGLIDGVQNLFDYDLDTTPPVSFFELK